MSSDRLLRAAAEFNVIARKTRMPGRCDPNASFETPALSHAVSLWQQRAAGRGLPRRGDLNARTLKPFLPNVMIVDAIDDGALRRYRVRLTGTSIGALLGDHTGKFLDEAVGSPYRERWTAALDAAIAAGEPIRLFGRLDYKAQHYLETEILLAPMDSGGGDADSVLVVLYAKYSTRHLFEPMVRNAIAASRT